MRVQAELFYWTCEGKNSVPKKRKNGKKVSKLVNLIPFPSHSGSVLQPYIIQSMSQLCNIQRYISYRPVLTMDEICLYTFLPRDPLGRFLPEAPESP